jgi:hypothetical protein
MDAITTPQRLSWTDSDLYRELSAIFPELRTRQQNVLDVEKLAEEIKVSRECVYKWLRAGRILSPKGVKSIVELANREPYQAALTRAGRIAPTAQDFARFMLA